jgi:hypothetical protein
MKLSAPLGIALSLVALICLAAPSPRTTARPTGFETRCGWFSNPTPANAWLWDREGEWIISVQGGFQADGDWPDFKPRQWVRSNGNYGYGCACLNVRVNKQTHQILEIKSSRARSLGQCRNDPALRKWTRKL